MQQQVVAELQQLRAELELRDQQYNAALDELEVRVVCAPSSCPWLAAPLPASAAV